MNQDDIMTAIEGRTWEEAKAIFRANYQKPGAELAKVWEDGEDIGYEKMINDHRLLVGVKNGNVVLQWKAESGGNRIALWE